MPLDNPQDSQQKEQDPFVCLGCGCLCDDVKLDDEKQIVALETNHPCKLGTSWYPGHSEFTLDELGSGILNKELGRVPDERLNKIEQASQLLAKAKNPSFLGGTGIDLRSQNKLLFVVQKIRAAFIPWPKQPNKKDQQKSYVPKLHSTWDVMKNESDLVIFWGGDILESHPRFIERVFSPSSLIPNRSFIFIHSNSNDSYSRKVKQEVVDRLGYSDENLNIFQISSSTDRQLELIVNLRGKRAQFDNAKVSKEEDLLRLIHRKLSNSKRVQVLIGSPCELLQEQWNLLGAHEWGKRDFGISYFPPMSNTTGLLETMLAIEGINGPLGFTPEGKAHPIDDKLTPRDLQSDLLIIVGTEKPECDPELQSQIDGIPYIYIGPSPSQNAIINIPVHEMDPSPKSGALLMRSDGRVLHRSAIERVKEIPTLEDPVRDLKLPKDPDFQMRFLNSRRRPEDQTKRLTMDKVILFLLKHCKG